jgi:hypothetical protein
VRKVDLLFWCGSALLARTISFWKRAAIFDVVFRNAAIYAYQDEQSCSDEGRFEC